MEERSDIAFADALRRMSRRYEGLLAGLSALQAVETFYDHRLPLDAVCTSLLRALTRETLAENASFMFLSPADCRLEIRAVASALDTKSYFVDREIWNGKRFALGEGIAGDVAKSGMPRHVDDSADDPLFVELAESGVLVRSLMCFPLFHRQRVMGVLNLSRSIPGGFSRELWRVLCIATQGCGRVLGDQWFAYSGEASPLEGMTDERRTTPITIDGPSSPDRSLRSQRIEALGELAGGLAHNLNNMLTEIVGNLDLALLEEDGDTCRTRIQDARRASMRGAELVRKLGAFGRIADATKSTLPLETVLQDLLSYVRSTFPARYEILLEKQANLWSAFADPGQLHQALLALCLNARDALQEIEHQDPERPCRIVVAAENVRFEDGTAAPHTAPGPERWVRLSVSDNGAGMDPETQSRIFEPFFSTRKGDQRSGLGLPMVFRILQEHEGWMDVRSTPGVGSVISLYLRAVDDPAEVEPKLHPQSARSPESTHILIADDEPAVLALAAAMLKRLGYVVTAVRDGKEAVDLFHQHKDRVDLVILDVIMPRMGGMDALRAIRNLNPDVPAILSSGNPGEPIEGGEESLAPTLFLAKPYLIATVADCVQRALASRA